MNHDYYLDFYHACEYLDEASKSITQSQNHSSELSAVKWLNLAKTMLKAGESQALQAGMPISLGEIEGGHCSVLQARLKKPGAWWSLENAENMAHLKVSQEKITAQ